MNETHEVAAISGTDAGPRHLCPKCQSPRVFRSHRHNRVENSLGWLNYYPYRCHACNHRFWAKQLSGTPKQPTRTAAREGGVKDPRPHARKRRSRQWIRSIVIGSICIALFLLFLHYLVQVPTYSGD